MSFATRSVSGSRSHSAGRSLRGVLVAAVAAVLIAPVQASDPENDQQLPPTMQSSALRFEARIAAEQGDFLKAVSNLEEAALVVGDRETARKAAAGRRELEAQGGSMADFSSLMTLIMEQTAPPAQWVMNGDYLTLRINR